MEKPSSPGKRRMKAFDEFCRKQISRIWPHPSLCRRSRARHRRNPDERRSTGILTPGLSLAPAFPMILQSVAFPMAPFCGAGVELVSRYSGATVPDFHGVP